MTPFQQEVLKILLTNVSTLKLTQKYQESWKPANINGIWKCLLHSCS